MPESRDTLDVGGQHRRYTCHLPASLETPHALLVALHGRNLTVDEMRRITHLDPIADRHGFLVAYPEGYQRSWNDGRGNTPAERAAVDDVDFIRCLIDHLVAQHGIDPSRVGVTGLSNGAVMCHRLGLELGHCISVIAPVAGTMPAALADVMPPYAVSALLIHGTRDQIAPFQGGRARGLAQALLLLGGVRGLAAPVLSFQATAERWRTIDRCTETTLEQSLPATARDPTSVERFGWQSGQGGTAVACWIVERGGHTWPGGPPAMGLGLLGRTTTHVDAGDIICRFMATHWRPAADRALDRSDPLTFAAPPP